MIQCGTEIFPQFLVLRDKGTGQNQGHQQLDRALCVIPHSNSLQFKFQEWTYFANPYILSKKE